MNDEEILRNFNELNPDLGQPHEFYIRYVGNGKSKEIYFPEWLSSKLGVALENPWIDGRRFSSILRKNSILPQIFYDSVILGITNISQRPKCPICGKDLVFRTLLHGYEVTCSSNCHSELKRRSYLSNPKMMKKGGKHTKEVLEKISASSKNQVISEETRRKRSEYMKSFAKTEEGKRFYEMVGKKVSKSNHDILSGEKQINTPTGYYISSRFNRGKLFVPTFNKTFTYDSGWEKLFLEYFMEELNIKDIEVFDRCKQGIPYIDSTGKSRNYYPDFYIKFVSGIRLVIEIKPKHLLNSDELVKLKIKAGEEFFKTRGIKYLVFTEETLFEKNLGKLKIKQDFNINVYNN